MVGIFHPFTLLCLKKDEISSTVPTIKIDPNSNKSVQLVVLFAKHQKQSYHNQSLLLN